MDAVCLCPCLQAFDSLNSFKGTKTCPQKAVWKGLFVFDNVLGAWKHVERAGGRAAAREAGILNHRQTLSAFRHRSQESSPVLNPERHGPGAAEDGADIPSSDDSSQEEMEPLLHQPSQPSPRQPSPKARRSGMYPETDSEDEDDEEEEFVSQTAAGDCEKLYRSRNNCPKTLLSMATGIYASDGKRRCGDFEDDPLYANVPSKKEFKPTADMFKEEMERRARNAGLNMKKFKTKSLSRKQALEWLLLNPVKQKADVRFLRREEGLLYKTIEDAAAEAEQAKKEKLLTGNWTGNLPWLRLYCAMCDDDCRQALALWNRSLNREELDARNSSDRPMNYWQMVCNKYNDPKWKVLTDALPDLHPDFSDCILLQLEDMPGGPLASAEDARKKGAEARAKLMQVS